MEAQYSIVTTVRAISKTHNTNSSVNGNTPEIFQVTAHKPSSKGRLSWITWHRTVNKASIFSPSSGVNPTWPRFDISIWLIFALFSR